jgi:hypothetical protein
MLIKREKSIKCNEWNKNIIQIVFEIKVERRKY